MSEGNHLDQSETWNQIDHPEFRGQDALVTANWLRHHWNTGAADIDALLLEGATNEQLFAVRTSFRKHLNHLKNVHGIRIDSNGGFHRFAARANV